jgi:MHS family proline/betaine transporter-like MFS transporter
MTLLGAGLPSAEAAVESDTRAARRRVIAAGVVGNVLEWYDFALYGVLAPIIATHFFPGADHLAALINSYAVFALGFVARPFGGVVFGHIGDRFGRRQLLTISVAMMALPTCLMGLLPTYQSIGVLAPVLLVVLRLVQGVSAGGEFSGSIIFLVEAAPRGRRGLYGSVANFGAMIGGLLGSGCGWLMSALLSAEAMQGWGWRVPFLSGTLVGLFGLWARAGIADSPEFNALATADSLERRPLRAAFRREGRQMAVTVGLNWVASVGYYVVFVWFVSNATEIIGLPYRTALGIGTLGLTVGLIATLAMGHLSDLVGQRRMLVAGSLATAVLAVPLLLLAATGTLPAVLLAQFGLAILAAIFLGTLPAVFVSLHGVAMRCTSLSLAYNAALALFGGTAPLIATVLVKVTGWPAAPGLYLALTALVCGALVRFVPQPASP